MRSIERRFEIAVQRNPNLSTYTCFAKAIKYQGFSRRSIRQWFECLVEKEDYQKSDTQALVAYLAKLSNTPEECTFKPEIALGEEILEETIETSDTFVKGRNNGKVSTSRTAL
ncbi:MAG: hypothetical protein Q7S95_02705 [bacterium]|nr:hypothetical protein [bacterium]